MSHARQPPGGHVFDDPSGQTIRSDMLDGLLDAIEVYRANNALPAGNPAAEVEAVYRTKFPWLVSKVGLVATVADDPLTTWINHAWRTPQAPFVESIPSECRIAICMECPHYEQAAEFSPDQLRRLSILGRGKFSDRGTCAKHKWAVGLAVWLENAEVRETVPGCWAT